MKIFELEVRYNRKNNNEKVKLVAPEQVGRYIKKLYSSRQADWKEYGLLICLNNASEVIGYSEVSHGSINQTVLDSRIVFGIALGCQATSIIMVHNHPSGTLLMGNADSQIAKRLESAGDLLDIKMADFIIYTSTGYYSKTADRVYDYEV